MTADTRPNGHATPNGATAKLLPQPARPASRTDPPLPARLPLLLQSARTRRRDRRARHRDLGARLSRGRGTRRAAGASLRRRARPRGATWRITAAARAPGSTPTSSPRAVGLTAQRLASSPTPGSTTSRFRSRTATPASADRIAGYEGAYASKRALAAEVVRAEAAAHRQRRHPPRQYRARRRMVDLALDARRARVEIAHVQYYGWALKNRAALMPTREQVERARAASSRCASSTTAGSSSTPSCRTITRDFPRPASAAGAAAR